MFLSLRPSKRAAAVAAATAAAIGVSSGVIEAPHSVAVSTCADPASSYAGGDGSSDTPYQISTVAQLMLLQSTTDALGSSFILNNDIDMASCTWDAGIGSVPNPFTGKFDGNGHTIKNLTVTVAGDYSGNAVEDGAAGLFGKLGNDALVKDLTVTGSVSADIEGEGAGAYAGGIAGRAVGATIQGSTFRGKVTSQAMGNHPYAGGLVGSGNFTTITASGAAADVSAGSQGRPAAGGLAGLLEGDGANPATMSDSWAVGRVYAIGDAQSLAGGLIGLGKFVSVARSFTHADVQADKPSQEPAAGGLIGFGIVNIRDSFSRSNVNGARFAGGLVGWLQQEDGFDTLENSYASGTVTQGGMANGGKGGLIGQADWTAPLTGATAQNAVWDTTTTTATDPAGYSERTETRPVPVRGANPLTTSDMTSTTTYADRSWVIAEGWNPTKVWGICANYNEGLPFLTAPYSTDVCASPTPTASISPSTQTFSGDLGSAVSLPTYGSTGFVSPPVFVIGPALVSGVVMDTATGAISGAVGKVSEQTSYEVGAYSGPLLQSASATVTKLAAEPIAMPGQVTTFLRPDDDNGAFQAIAARPDGASLVVSYGVESTGGTTTGVLVSALMDSDGDRVSVTRVGGDTNIIGSYSQPSVAYNPISGGWITCFARLVTAPKSQPMCQYLNADGAPVGDAFAIDGEFADKYNQNAIAYSPVRRQFLVVSTARSTSVVGRWVAADGSGVVGGAISYSEQTTTHLTYSGGVDLAYSTVSDTFGLVVRGKVTGEVNSPAPWMFMLDGDGQPIASDPNPVRMNDNVAEDVSNGSVAYSARNNEFILVAFAWSDPAAPLTTRTFSAATGTPANEVRTELTGEPLDTLRWRPIVAADQAGTGYVVTTPLKTANASSVSKVFTIDLDAEGVPAEPVLLAGSVAEPTGSRPRITYRSAFCDFLVSYQLNSTTWGRQAFVGVVPGSTSCGTPSPSPTATPTAPPAPNNGGSGSGGIETPSPATPSRPAATPGSPSSGNPMPIVSAASQSVFRQPSLPQAVTSSVTLVAAPVAAAAPTRAVRQELSLSIGSAPVVSARVNEPVKLLVKGFTPGAAYVVQVKSSTGYVVLGAAVANANGQLELPVFRNTQSAETTIAIVASTGKASYIKVNTSTGKKKAGARSAKSSTVSARASTAGSAGRR